MSLLNTAVPEEVNPCTDGKTAVINEISACQEDEEGCQDSIS